jgi:hypothetical protein
VAADPSETQHMLEIPFKDKMVCHSSCLISMSLKQTYLQKRTASYHLTQYELRAEWVHLDMQKMETFKKASVCFLLNPLLNVLHS